MDNPIQYKALWKFYDLFDLFFLLGGKGNPRSGLSEIVQDTPARFLDICVGTAVSSFSNLYLLKKRSVVSAP